MLGIPLLENKKGLLVIGFLFFCFLVSYFVGLLDLGFLVVGFLASWFLGLLVLKFLGFLVSWFQRFIKSFYCF